MKNVIAIAAGAAEGLDLGRNAMAALITRGLVEISRLACALGGRRETLAGLSGLGDLVLTCTGDLSRNRRVGIALGRGRRLAEILAGMRMVAEGVKTTGAALALGERHGVELPIAAQMADVLSGRRAPQEALEELDAQAAAGRMSFFDKLRSGLARTKEQFLGRFGGAAERGLEEGLDQRAHPVSQPVLLRKLRERSPSTHSTRWRRR